MDKLRDVLLFVAGIVSIGSLIMAAFEGFNQRIASASFLATLGLVCTLIVFIPQLEVLKAFGIEAKLRQTYTEAVATLASVKRMAEITARSSYLTIAWGNRLGSPNAKEKQEVLNDMDAQMADLKVSPEDRALIVRPWLRMIKVDFFILFTNVVREIATLKASELTAEIHATQSQEASDKSLAHSNLITPWSQQVADFGPLKRLETDSLSKVIGDYMPPKGGWLSDKELAAIDVFKQEIVRFNADCERKGGYTAEAADFYDYYSSHKAEKAKELWEASKK